jgi:hypothetical protein
MQQRQRLRLGRKSAHITIKPFVLLISHDQLA